MWRTPRYNRAPSTVVDSVIPGVDVIKSAHPVVSAPPVPDPPISPFAPAVPATSTTASIETVGVAFTPPASVSPTVKTSAVSRPRRSTVGNWKDGPAKDKAGAYETVRMKDILLVASGFMPTVVCISKFIDTFTDFTRRHMSSISCWISRFAI